MNDVSQKYDEYGFSREWYVFPDEQQCDAAWRQICQAVIAPDNLKIIHVSAGKYFEQSSAETMSHATTKIVRLMDDGRPAIMVYFHDHLSKPNKIIKILDDMPNAKRSEP